MARPSDPLLQWLRDMLEKKGVNTAHVANSAGIKRARARRILSGAEPMLVDELLQLSEALELSPADMGLPVDVPDLPEPADDDPAPEDFVPVVNPWVNHHRQLLQIAFALGCNFAFVVETEQLTDSGIPQSVLDAHSSGEMLITLDAAFHKYNNPRYEPEAVVVTLSFDSIYDCRFPWNAIQRVFFTPAPVEDIEGDDEEEPPTPHLRLVT